MGVTQALVGCGRGIAVFQARREPWKTPPGPTGSVVRAGRSVVVGGGVAGGAALKQRALNARLLLFADAFDDAVDPL